MLGIIWAKRWNRKAVSIGNDKIPNSTSQIDRHIALYLSDIDEWEFLDHVHRGNIVAYSSFFTMKHMVSIIVHSF